MTKTKKIAIFGSGPAGLMAAAKLSELGSSLPLEIHLFEKRAGLGRKLLIAGSSGLNISHDLSSEAFAKMYEGGDSVFWEKLFTHFGVQDWIRFIEKELGLETFLGTSHRYFVKEMKAASLMKRWTELLKSRGVTIANLAELVDFYSSTSGIEVSVRGANAEVENLHFDFVIFALGGASWETETPSWIDLFERKKIPMNAFAASNVGYEVDWSKKFLEESEGKPLKKVMLETSRGRKLGEMAVTAYGLEGTPIYFCGTEGQAFLDLKPDLSEIEILNRLSALKENMSPIRRVKHHLALSQAAESLLFHSSSVEARQDLQSLVRLLKRLPIQLKKARPLSESISSRGGVSFDAVDENLQIKSYPHAYCIGEMLSWDAPTGGFLIQASVSEGAWVAEHLKGALR